MPFPDIAAWAPAQVTSPIGAGGYQIPPEALKYLSAEQIKMLGGSSQQNPVDAFIASLPPEVDRNNPTAILQAASGNPSMSQAVIEKFGIQNANEMKFENPYRHPLSEALVAGAKDVLIPYGAAMGAMALTGAGAGGGAAGASGAGGGAASTFPLPAAGGAITATPIAAGAGAATAAGAAGAAGATNALTGAAGFADKWLPTIVGGANALLGVNAANRATDAEVAGMQQGIDEQKRQFDLTRADWQPWMDTGKDALTQMSDPGTYFEKSPDYGFIRGEGTRDIENSFSARGGAASGNALRALAEFNSGLAKGDFNNWFNRQSVRAGLGSTGTSAVTSAGTNAANNTSNYLTGQGVSRASGVYGRNASIAQGANDIATNYLYRRRRAA